MTRVISLFIVLAAVTVFMNAQENCLDLATSREMARCISRQRQDAEDRLAAAVAAVENDLSLAERKEFRNTQKVWEKYRAMHCKFAGSMFEGGSLQPLFEGTCYVTLTIDRARDVRLLEVQSSDPGKSPQR